MTRLFLSFFLSVLTASIPVPAQLTAGSRHVSMGVVLPLKEKTARGAKMVEFYQGMLMAVDSLKRDGISVDVQALHSGTTAADMDQLIFERKLKDCDVVFGPLDAAQLTGLADFCDLHGIHLVVPFSTIATQLENHPRHYLVNAPRLLFQREAIWFIQNQFAEYNVVLVDCDEDNEEGKAFGDLLRNTLSGQGIYVRPLNLNADDMAYQQAFNALRKNLVVLNSNSMKAINQLAPKLKDFKREHPEYQLSLLGYPSWQTYTQQLLSVFYSLDTYVFTNFYRNPLAQRCDAIDRLFMNWFHTPMSATFPRYGLMGFDVAYFFLRGLSIYGKEHLEKNLTRVPALPYQHPFYFEQTAAGDGYVNTFVELIHYTPYQSIELITRNR